MKILILACVSILTLNISAISQDWDNIKITPIKVHDNLYMMTGEGGNLGVSIGEDGIFLIDDQYAPLTEKILAAIGTLSKDGIKFAFNTQIGLFKLYNSLILYHVSSQIVRAIGSIRPLRNCLPKQKLN